VSSRHLNSGAIQRMNADQSVDDLLLDIGIIRDPLRRGILVGSPSTVPREGAASFKWVDRDGNQIVMVNLSKFWEKWQSSQRDTNIHRPAVEEYKEKMRAGQDIQAVAFETLIFNDDAISVRTLDGRHRITAAHELGVRSIGVISTVPTSEIISMLDLGV
jgi:hypothetical protein